MNPSPARQSTIATERRVYSAAKVYARENRVQSWFHLWVVVLCVGCSYSIILHSTHVLLSFIMSLLLSLLLVRFFVIYHDYVHKTILQNSIIATVIFTFFGLYILAPISIWNRTQNHHHQHNSKLNGSGIGSYPIITKKEYLDSSPSERFFYLVTRHPFTILAGYFTTFLYGMCLRSVVNNFRKHYDSLLALGLHTGIGLILFLAGGIGPFIFSFLLPALISSCLGSYLFYVQHNYPGVAHRLNENWSYYNAAMASSAYIKMNPVMEWFTANIGYHHIHHLNAAIPFYKLPKAYNAIPELKIEKDTSLHPFDIWKCLKLKVWDPATNKMIGVKNL